MRSPAARLLLIPCQLFAITNGLWWWSAALFCIAAATDLLDGHIARALDQATPFGGVFDHATDALYVSVATWGLSQIGIVNGFLPWLIGAAFLQYLLDSRALQGRQLRASSLGRINGVAYFVLLGVAIGAECFALGLITTAVGWAAWALVVTTVLSMADRAWTFLNRSS